MYLLIFSLNYIFCMIPIIFTIKIAEFDHVLFKQRGDSRGEAATSCASSQIV